ncbi:MAG: hypothetical protein AB7T06_34705 [Kofleriaceae bacterium]
MTKSILIAFTLFAGCMNVELESSEQSIAMAPGDAMPGDSQMDAPAMDAPAMDAPAMDAPAMDAPAFSKTTTNNQAKTQWQLARETFLSPPSKADQISDRGALEATKLPANPAVANRTMAIGGTCVKVSNAPDGYLVGSSGAEGCIIAVIVTCDGTAYACHFTATDDAKATLAQLGPFGACAHAAIAGGTNEGPSNITLQQVLAELDRQEVTIDGILDRIGVYWDGENNRWVYGPLEVPSQNR